MFLAQSLSAGPATPFPEELARMQASAGGDYYYCYCSYCYYYLLNTPFPEKKKKVICKDALLGDKYASSRGQGFISLVQRFLEVVQLTR